MPKKIVFAIVSALLLIGLLLLRLNVQLNRREAALPSYPIFQGQSSNYTSQEESSIGHTEPEESSPVSKQKIQLALETGKPSYLLGENVTIILKNIGNETANFTRCPVWQIFKYPEEQPIYPKNFSSLEWNLKPMTIDTFTWNQYDDFNQSFCKLGLYVVRDTEGWGISAFFKITSEKILVPDDCTTIQDAIELADPGAIIYVNAGIYYEHLIVNKPVSLVGENRNTTILDGNRTGTVVLVTADFVNITQFSIVNGYCTPHVTYGIEVRGCKNVTISDSSISQNDYGVFLYYSNFSLVKNNLLFDNWMGIGIALSSQNYVVYNEVLNSENSGIGMGSGANDNVIHNNTISQNDFCGVQVGWSSGNKISENFLIRNNEAGIRLDSSTENEIVGNYIALNNRDGIVLFGSDCNAITENTIDQNGWDAIALWYSNFNEIYNNNGYP